MPAVGTHEDRREQIYALLAEAVDGISPDQERLYLAKVALLLAFRLDDPDAVAEIVSRCWSDL
jgi:hypothetical protein